MSCYIRIIMANNVTLSCFCSDNIRSGTLKTEAPHDCARPQFLILAACYSPTTRCGSTIAAEGLNCCVRDGNRWNPFAIATKNSDSTRLSCSLDRQLRSNCNSFSASWKDEKMHPQNCTTNVSYGNVSEFPCGKLHLQPQKSLFLK